MVVEGPAVPSLRRKTLANLLRIKRNKTSSMTRSATRKIIKFVSAFFQSPFFGPKKTIIFTKHVNNKRVGTGGASLVFEPNEHSDKYLQNCSHNFTICAHFCYDDTCYGHDGGHIIGHGGGWSAPGYSLLIYNEGLRVQVQNKIILPFVRDFPINVRTWHQILMAMRKVNNVYEMSLVLDGQVLQDMVQVPFQVPTVPCLIGGNKAADNSNEHQFKFKGYICNVKMFDIFTTDYAACTWSTQASDPHLMVHVPMTFEYYKQGKITDTKNNVLATIANMKSASRMVPLFVDSNMQMQLASTMAANMATMYNDEMSSDLTLQLQTADCMVEFKVHRVIIAARSPYFKQLLYTSKMKEVQENTIVLQLQTSSDALRHVLKYMYSDACNDLNESNAVEILILADLFQLDALHKYVEVFLVNQLNHDNANDLLQVATAANATLLQKVCKYALHK